MLRMAERYKAGAAGRRVPGAEAAQLPGQPAGNAYASPTAPEGGPDLDEYAYLGTPSPPVTHQESQYRPQLATEYGQGPFPPLPAPGPLDPRTATPVPRGYTYGDDQITRDPNGAPAWEQKPPNKDVAWDALTAVNPSIGGSLRMGVTKGAGAAAHYGQMAMDLADEYVPKVGSKIRELDQRFNPLNSVLPRSLPPEPPKQKQGPPEATLRSYTPSWRDQLGALLMGDSRASPERARAVEGLVGSRGLGNTGMSISDVVPGSQVLGALEANQEGDHQGAALAVLPIPGAKMVAKAAKVAAPAILRDEAAAATEKIRAHAAQERRPTYPPATQPVFKGDETGALTRELVPQTSIRDQLPRPEPGTKNKDLPSSGRAGIIAKNVEPISEIIARDLGPMVQANARPGQFYHTGGVLQGLTDIGGLSPTEALGHMGRWSGQGAATSPRTATPQNLRNASYLLWRQAQNDPLTLEKFMKEGNMPGFAMMGMHARLGDEFARGAVNINTNPKPFVFQRNWSGNLADVTADTHNIRATLAALDELQPGKLPREWFVSDEAHKAYKKRGGFGKDPLPVGDIKDTLEGATAKKVYKQSEYGVMTEPWYRAAERLGIDPATGQAHGWFGYGGRTGLRSPEATIDDLLNAQIEATSRATGLHPEKILQLWGRGRIPLAAAPGGDAQSQVG
jgi:hypothetical protein